MNIVIIVIFAVSLIYMSIMERFRNLVLIIGLQGLLLFVLSFFELGETSFLNLVFITAETFIFKAIVVPVLLFRILKKTGITKIHSGSLPGIYSILLTMAGLILCIILAASLGIDGINVVFFTVALFALFTGLFFIISHKRIFSHLIGFLVIENAVFMLSLAFGREMAYLIDLAILLDIFVSILILGVFIIKLNPDVDSLKSLKD